MLVRVLRFDVVYTARFARPAYGFVARWVDLYAAIHARLGRFRSRPEDIRFESTGGQAHEFHVSCTSLPLDMIARYRLGSLEVWTRNALLTREPPALAEVIAAAIAAARDVVPDLTIESQTMNPMGHAQLGVPVSQILDQVAIGSDWARPRGALFTVSAGDEAGATVEVQPSAAFPEQNNIWASTILELPGSVEPLDAAKRAQSLVDDLLRRVHVDLDWGKS